MSKGDRSAKAWAIRETERVRREMLVEGLKRYGRADCVPSKHGNGILHHNRVRHSVDMPCGLNGFRWWRQDTVLEDFESCQCGYAGLPHYSQSPDYKCEPLLTLPA